MTIDIDRILDRILEIFVAERNNWFTYRQLAYRISGDGSQADVIAAVVESRPKVFVFKKNKHRSRQRFHPTRSLPQPHRRLPHSG
jgi:hypothetical protein